MLNVITILLMDAGKPQKSLWGFAVDGGSGLGVLYKMARVDENKQNCSSSVPGAASLMLEASSKYEKK